MQNQVFLSYNRNDKDDVDRIAEKLRVDLEKVKLKVWQDSRDLRPGEPWQKEAANALGESVVIVVFIGPSKIGDWQEKEIQSALTYQAENKTPVIPIILPKAEPPTDKAYSFLKENTWVDFRESIDDEHEYGRLLYGITGKKSTRREKSGVEPAVNHFDGPVVMKSDAEKRVDAAVQYINACFLDDRNVTYFLGTGASQENNDPDLPPRVREMTHELFSDLGLVKEEYRQFLLAAVDTAGQYYAFKRNEPLLERKVKDLIMARSRKIPPVYVNLVYLLLKLEAGQSEPDSKQLIVTTNFDLLIEATLLLSGMPFTRIVQDRSGKKIYLENFNDRLPDKNVDTSLNSFTGRLDKEFGRILELARSSADDIGYLSKWISNYREDKYQEFMLDKPDGDKFSLNELDIEGNDTASILLYKFHGSLDIRKSFAISTDHYLNFMIRKQQNTFIPKQVSQIIANTPSLFLGYAPLDPDLRLTFYILRKQIVEKDDRRYAIPLLPLGEENDHWGDITEAAFEALLIQALEDTSNGFIKRLIDTYSASM